MAENSTRAFGRYLKALRERRDLSLDEVASLSQTFPEKINKGYLSRCENGHQKLGFSKVIALSRIYEVPADVLVERMELDLELDRVGGPDTEGMTFTELTDAGKKAMEQGFFSIAYALLRDGVNRATVDPIKPSYRDIDEQAAVAQLNCATAARALGRHRYPLHEFLYLDSGALLGPKFRPIALERIASCYSALKELRRAEKYADRAIASAEKDGRSEYIAFFFYTRGRVAMYDSDLRLATEFYQKAHGAFKDINHRIGCALALNSIAQCYFDLKRYKSARRAAEAARKIATSNERPRSEAFSLLLLGEIDEVEDRPRQALRRWKSAAAIAKKLNDRELRFKAEFLLFKRALSDDDQAASRSIKRRLRRLAPQVPANVEELDAFHRLLGEKVGASFNFVAGSQQTDPS